MDDLRRIERTTDMNDSKISAKGVQVYYGDTHAIKDVSVEIGDKTVTAFIGPSGCGKSTFLRCLNRMNDTIDICRVQGSITMDDQDIYDPRVDPVQLRAKVGMVFQKPNPSPSRFMTTWLMAPRFMGSRGTRPIWMGSSRHLCAVRPCGTRSRTGSILPVQACRVASSSACASRAPSPPPPKFC